MRTTRSFCDLCGKETKFLAVTMLKYSSVQTMALGEISGHYTDKEVCCDCRIALYNAYYSKREELCARPKCSYCGKEEPCHDKDCKIERYGEEETRTRGLYS